MLYRLKGLPIMETTGANGQATATANQHATTMLLHRACDRLMRH